MIAAAITVFSIFGLMIIGVPVTLLTVSAIKLRSVRQIAPKFGAEVYRLPWPVLTFTEAAYDFAREWERVFGDTREDIIGYLGDCQVFMHHGRKGVRKLPNGYAGITDTATKVQVAYVTDDRIGDTALFHEWIHICLWRIHGFREAADANHAEPSGPWTDAHDDLDAKLSAKYRKRAVPEAR